MSPAVSREARTGAGQTNSRAAAQLQCCVPPAMRSMVAMASVREVLGDLARPPLPFTGQLGEVFVLGGFVGMQGCEAFLKVSDVALGAGESAGENGELAAQGSRALDLLRLPTATLGCLFPMVGGGRPLVGPLRSPSLLVAPLVRVALGLIGPHNHMMTQHPRRD